MNAILDSVRSKVDGTLQRVHLMTRKDLHNITRDFKITYNEKLHENDYISVGLWVQKMMTEPQNPVAFFKHQNQQDDSKILNRTDSELLQDKDFLLVVMTLPQEQLLKSVGTDRICIDGTHGTNGSDRVPRIIL